VGGYEEHLIFDGAGAISKELYTRLKNAGFPIMWHPSKKIYHPWHANTLIGEHNLKLDQQLWVVQCRDLSVDHVTSSEQAELYLNRFTARAERHKSSIRSIGHKIKNVFREIQLLGNK
jgi:hypothetical protein